MPIKILLAVIFVVLLGLNVKATVAIYRDSLSEALQRWVQFLLVWLLPIIGSVVVLAVHRQTEEASGKYQKQSGEIDDIDDFDTGITSAADMASDE